MKKKSSLVSIIVACYNIENFVDKCLKSLKNQTYTNIEVLMIDDGSKDKTADILKQYEKKDKRFKYLKKKNGGLSDARNYGIKRANGDYICFVDGDDYVEKQYIELLLDSIILNNADVAVCYFNRIYDNKTKVNIVGNKNYELIRHPAAWNKMYKKEYFDKLEFIKGIWYEDLNFFGKILMDRPKVSIVKKPLYNYFQNSSSIMHTYDDRIYQIYTSISDIEKYAKENEKYDSNKELLEFINVYHILIGTIYRASFNNNFCIDDMKKIHKYVIEKYPNYNKNGYLKKLSIFMKMYLFMLKCNYRLTYIFIKLLSKRIVM